MAVNPLARVAVPPSGFVTTTLYAPLAFFGILIVKVSCVPGPFTVIVEATVGWLLPVKVTVAPGWKPVPVIVSATPFEFAACVFGVIERIVGAAFTVRPFVNVNVPPSGLVTVTSAPRRRSTRDRNRERELSRTVERRRRSHARTREGHGRAGHESGPGEHD